MRRCLGKIRIGYFIFDGIRMIEEARPDSNIGG